MCDGLPPCVLASTSCPGSGSKDRTPETCPGPPAAARMWRSSSGSASLGLGGWGRQAPLIRCEAKSKRGGRGMQSGAFKMMGFFKTVLLFVCFFTVVYSVNGIAQHCRCN